MGTWKFYVMNINVLATLLPPPYVTIYPPYAIVFEISVRK